MPVIALLMFAGCGGGGGGLDPNPDPIPQGQWEGTVATSSAANPGFVGVPELPFDSGDRLPSTAGTLELLGSEFIQQFNGVVDGTSLVLVAPDGEVGDDGPIAYGLYSFTGLIDVEPQFLNIECMPRLFGEEYYVLLADFTAGDWAWFGPVSFPEFELNLQDQNHRFVTELGNMYFLVLCGPGNGATISRSVLTVESSDGGGDDNRLPGTPHHLEATDGTFENQVVVEWGPGDGATGYEVWRRLDGEHGEWAAIGETEVTRYEDEDVEPGVVYVYKARSFNEAGSSEFSNHDTGFAGTEGGGENPPGQPHEIWASDGAHPDHVVVEWGYEGEYDYFELWRRLFDGGEFEHIASIDGEHFRYEDWEVDPGVVYKYKVRAILGDVEGPFSEYDTGYASDEGGDPHAPFDLVASDGNYEDKVRIEWMMEGDWDYFKLYRRVDHEGSEWDMIGEVEAAEYNDFNVEPGVVYLYKVVAVLGEHTSGHSNTDSGYASGDDPSTPAPHELQASKGTYYEKIEVWWGFEGDYDYFEVWRRTDGHEGEFELIGTTETMEYIDTDLPGDFTFIYKARAILGEHEGPFSNTDHGYLKDRDPIGHPFGLVATDGTYEEKVRLEWGMEGDYDYFQIWRRLDGEGHEWDDLAQTEIPEYNDFAVEPGVVYLYKVYAVLGEHESEPSNVDSGFAGSNHNPGHPFELVATDGTYEEKVRIEWGMEGDYSYFSLWRKQDGEGHEWDDLAQTEIPAYNDFAVEPGVVYLYKVYAILGEQQSEPSNIDSGYAGSNGEGPGNPFELVATDGTYAEKVRLEWGMEGDYHHFLVYRRLDGEGNEWDLIADPVTTDYDDLGVDPGALYWYKVIAVLNEQQSDPSNHDSGYAGDR